MTDFLHEGLMPAPTDGPHEWHPSGSAAFTHVRYGHEPEVHGWASHHPSAQSDTLIPEVRTGSGHRRARVIGVHVDLGLPSLADQEDTEHCRPVRDLDRQPEDL